VHGGGSFRSRPAGYCPRCNSKGRHRLIWLYIQENPQLIGDVQRLLHISPHYSLGRRLSADDHPVYVGLDLETRPFVTVGGDLTALPFRKASFDAAICVHTLEHVEDDGAAIAELYRVTKTDGWVLVNVPMSPDSRTLEDVTVRTPHQRREMFGEETHVRVYGFDLVERLEAPGFHVEPAVQSHLSTSEMVRFGLPSDEKSFVCTRRRRERD
jgi:SAM-dependent methyltransferase